MNTRIAVLESKWWPKTNSSVKGMFDLIADINFSNPNAYHYEMAMGEAAMKEAIPRIAKDVGCKYLYVATHGDVDGLHLYNGEKLTRTELRNLLCTIKQTPRAGFVGIHLGSCLFATDEMASFLFDRPVGIKWLAGYTEEVDWIESSAVDLLFFNELLRYDGSTDLQTINSVAKRLRKVAGGLVEELGFGIFTRKRGGGIQNILQREGIADLEELS